VEDFASVEAFLNSYFFPDTRRLIRDARMPGMSGPEDQRRLAAEFREIPVVFITAHVDEAARSQVLKDGVKDYSLKPFREEASYQAIRAALK
jgi:FixJ family two-component response regulator